MRRGAVWVSVTLKIHVEALPEGMWADENRVYAFEEMYRRCYPPLVDLCRRILGGQGDAEAIAQEAFVRAWTSLDRFTGARPFWPWVATIARRLCIDHRRRRDREAMHLHVAALVGDAWVAAPDESIETDEEGRSALLALQRLNPSERRVITLRDVNGMSYDEMAQFEGVTVESIRGSLKRARASLRRAYAKVAAGAPAVLAGRRLQVRTRLTDGARWTSRQLAAGAPLGAVSELAAVVVMTAAVSLTAGAQAPDATHGMRSAIGAVYAPPASESTAPEDVSASGASTTQVRHSPTVAAGRTSDGADQPPMLGGILPSDGAASPEDAVFTQFVASPSYASDGTVIAVGRVGSGCPYGPCAVLFRSDDRGATWHRLAGAGFTGGNVLLPPSFPVDGRIFVASPTALLVSGDGGASFSMAAPVGGPAAMSPRFSEDHKILIGQAPGWEYRDDLSAMSPSGLVIASTSLSTTPVFSPSYATDGLVFIGGTGSALSANESAVFRCVRGVCGEQQANLVGVVGAPTVAVSPSIARSGTVVAWRGDAFYRSSDRGHSFVPVTLPVRGFVQGASFDEAGRLFVALRMLASGETTGAVISSVDGGRTWEVLGESTALARGAESVTALPDGRILAGLSAPDGGLACSSDGGLSWEARCSA